MLFSTSIKSSINKFLRPLNLQLETLTVEKLEMARFKTLEKLDHFEKSVFLVPKCFNSTYFESILNKLKLYKPQLNNLENTDINQVGYSYSNNFFTSPDTEVLYIIVREFQPDKVVEIGCGNSTKIIRQAIIDGQLNTRLLSIDPCPRTEIIGLSDELYLKPVETLENTELFRSLKQGDILFIDSSHTISTGNDVVFLYTKIIPELQPGVLIHIHDIFLPYEYPRKWVIEEQWGWNEQYLVQCMLLMSNAFEVLWAGHFIQRTYKDFKQYFPHLDNRVAQSLWLRKVQ